MKEAESICHNKAFQDAMMSTQNLLIVTLDTRGRVVFVNPEGAHILGYSQQDMIGKDWFANFLPQENIDEVRGVFNNIIKGNITQFKQYTNPVLTKSREKRFFAFNNAILKEEEKIIGTLSVGVDITNEIELTEKLKRTVEIDKSITELIIKLLESDNIEDISDSVLFAAQNLTDSPYGFVGFIDEKSGKLLIPTFSPGIRDHKWHRERLGSTHLSFDKFRGLWGWSLKEKKPILVNDADTDKRSTGTPDGHIKIKRFLAVPLLKGEKLLGQIAVANSKRDYNNGDLAILLRIADVYSIAIEKMKMIKNVRSLLKKIEIAVEVSDQMAYEHIIDTGKLIISGNAIKRVLGYDKDEIPDNVLELSKYLHPDDIERVLKLADGSIPYVEGQFRFRAKDGEYKWIRVRGYTFVDEQDGVKKTYGMYSDISERIKYEDELIRRSEEISNILDNLPLPVVVMDKFYNIINENKAFNAEFGYTKEDLADFDKWLATAFPSTQNEDIKKFIEGVAAGTDHLSAIEMVHKNGEVRYIKLFKRSVGTRLILMFENITNETIAKIREEGYTKKIESLARFPSESPDPLMRVDKDGILQYANLSSFTVTEFWGTSIGSIVPAHIYEVVRAALDSNDQKTIECYVKDKIYEFLIVPFVDAGYVNLYGVDTTEKRRYLKGLEEMKTSLEIQVQQRTEKLKRNEEATNILKDIIVSASSLESFKDILSTSAYQLSKKYNFKAYGYWISKNDDFSINPPTTDCMNEVGSSIEQINQRLFSALIKTNRETKSPIIIRKEDIVDYFPEGGERCFSSYEGILLVPVLYKSMNIGMLLFFLAKNTNIDDIVFKLLEQVGMQLGSILKQKESEYEREKIRQLYQTVLYTAGEGIVSTDKDLSIVYVNPAFEQITGYSHSEVRDLNIHKLFHKDSKGEEIHDVEHCLFYLVMKGLAEIRKEESIFIVKGGKSIYVNYVVRPIIDGTDINGVVVVLRDITEEKRKSQEINRLAAALEQYPVAIGFLDLDGNIIHINKAFEEIQGLKREDIIDKNIEQFNPGLTKDMVACAKGECKYILGRINRPDGSFVYENVAFAPITGENGEVINYMVIKEDITQYIEAQELADKAKVAAEESNRAKSSFLAAMSHELRTPLTGIKGYIENLLSTDCSERRIEFLKKAQRSVDHMIAIINDILDFSKVESGKMKLESKGFDLYNEIEKVQSITQVKIAEKGLEYKWDIPEDIPHFLIGDPKRLSQVLINLIGNATKFTSEGGIYVSVRLKSCIENKAVLLFSVRDTGIGIKPEDKVRIFNPFEQVDQTSYSRRYEGTGLGLPISKWIVENMNGEIWVESEVGRGSTFYFTAEFEITTKDQIELDEYIVPPPSMLRGARVLIVEDNDINRELALMMMQKYGAVTEYAIDGKAAVKLIMSHPPEYYTLVLMDIQMPLMDGITATKRIRADERYRNLPIIALSAHAFRDEIENMLTSGMSGHISKPFNENQMMKEISRFYCNEDATTKVEIASGKTKPIPDYLKSLSVLDLESALERLSGDIDKYEEMLKGFVVKYGDIDKEIERHIKDDMLEKAEEIVHLIKGVSGNLGIKNLYEKSAYLDYLLKADGGSRHEIYEAFRAFSEELKVVKKELQSLPEKEEAYSAVIDNNEYVLKLERLIKHLEGFDFISLQIFKEISPGLIAELGKDAVARIGSHIENMNYEEALQLLKNELDFKRGK